MEYRVVQDNSPRENSGAYWYFIYQGNRLVARYWHDFRGDEHGIEFVTGASHDWPVGRMIDFLEGGGREPLRLSESAIDYLDDRLSLKPSRRSAARVRLVSEKGRAISEFLGQANPLHLQTDFRDSGYEDYDKYVPHLVLLIDNGCRTAEIADYLEKIMGQRGMTTARETVVKLATQILEVAS